MAGTGCPDSAIFWLTEDGVTVEGAGAADADPDGVWTGQLNLDDSFSPARSYAVVADCYGTPGKVRFRYTSVPIDVLP